ncbi:MAG: cytidylate kinase family protein [Nanoarchaeota archaeon]
MNLGSSLRKRIITISGTPCSGKSSINALLVKQLGYQAYSVGSLVKRLALERGAEPESFYRQNIEKVVEVGGKMQSLDGYLDSYQRELGEQKERFILDSRLGFYFVPQSFRVFLSCDADVAAGRVHQARRHEKRYESTERAKQTISERADDELGNYAKKYGIPNFHMPFHYDMVINTSAAKPEEIAENILQQYRRYEHRTGELELVCKGLQMIEAKKFIYFSAPITGGKGLYAAAEQHRLGKTQDLPKEIFRGCIDENLQRYAKLGKAVKSRAQPSILPGMFGSSEAWSQRDYLDLSKEIIKTKATSLVFQDGWEYSNGCLEEYLLSMHLKKPALDQRRRPLRGNKALKLVAAAVDGIHKASIECPKLDFLSEQLIRAIKRDKWNDTALGDNSS